MRGIEASGDHEMEFGKLPLCSFYAEKTIHTYGRVLCVCIQSGHPPPAHPFCPFVRCTPPLATMLCTLPVEVVELIFGAVVWDDFSPECVESLNKASECIARVHERNQTLRALRVIAKFVDPILWRLSFKYVHITSHSRALELLSATGDRRLPGELVSHLFVGDRLGRYHVENAPSYTWVTSESGRYWVEWRILAGLLTLMSQLKSLHIHLPGIHSQIFSSSFIQSGTISSPALQTITCLSLYDDVNNSHCYQPVRSVPEARASLSGFVKLRDLIISESEGMIQLDRLMAFPSDQQPAKHNLPRMKMIMLEKWCPMGHDIILYNLVVGIPLSDLRVLRKVPRRMSMDGKVRIPSTSNVRYEHNYCRSGIKSHLIAT